AEDGIRDFHVTGVQTCALPISTRTAVAAACESLGIPLVWGTVQEWSGQLTVFWSTPPDGVEPIQLRDLYDPATTGEPPACSAVEIGRASCRASASMGVGAATWK